MGKIILAVLALAFAFAISACGDSRKSIGKFRVEELREEGRRFQRRW